MTTFKSFILMAVLVLAPVLAQAEKAAISVQEPYAFAVPAGTKSAAVFMTLTYPLPSKADPITDKLLRIETPVAERADIHTMVYENNVMVMRPMDGLPLPPTGSFSFKPQGVHIMLTGLKRDLKKGDKFPLMLVFQRAGNYNVIVDVRAPGDIPATDKGPADEPPEEKAVHQDMMMDMDHSHHDMKP